MLVKQYSIYFDRNRYPSQKHLEDKRAIDGKMFKWKPKRRMEVVSIVYLCIHPELNDHWIMEKRAWIS